MTVGQVSLALRNPGPEAARPSAEPPPIPTSVRSVAPVPPPAVEGGTSVTSGSSRPRYSDNPRDPGMVATALVWLVATAVLGGGLFGWFYGFAWVETHLESWAVDVPALEAGGTMLGLASPMDPGDDEAPVEQEPAEEAASEPEPPSVAAPAVQPPPRRGFSLPDFGSRGPSGTVEWPDMKMTGTFAGNRPEDGVVILDGVMVPAGQMLDGVAVRTVRSDSAELEYKGERRWVRSGNAIHK